MSNTNQEKKKMTSFEVSKTYATRSICDSNCIFRFRIERRTAKTVWVQQVIDGREVDEVLKKRVEVIDDVEAFSPFGKYSTSATIKADKLSDDVQKITYEPLKLKRIY